jgi:hypothetical protein
VKKFIVLSFLVCLSLAFSSASYAITNVHSLSIYQITDISGDCGRTIDYIGVVDEGLIVQGQLTATASVNDAGGGMADYYAFILKDATGKTIMHGNRLIPMGSTVTMTFGWNLQFSPTPNARPWTFYIYESGTGYVDPNYGASMTALASLTFDPAAWISTCDISSNPQEAPNIAPPDDRLNWRFGDNGFVVYKGEEDSDILFHVYRVDGESNGYWLLSVTKTQAEYYKNNPPNTAIQLNRYENATVFALTTGEIQVNMYNLSDGKTYVLVFNSEGKITNSYVLVGFYLSL